MLLARSDFVISLVRGFESSLLGNDFDLLWITQELSRDIQHSRRHGGREECKLSGFGKLGKDRLKVFAEAHRHHFVGFIEDAELDFVKLQRSPSEVIQNTARRTNHDLWSHSQGSELAVHRLATINRHDFQSGIFGKIVDAFGDLDGKLSGWGKNERLSVVVGSVKLLDQRKAKCRRFSGSRLSQPDEVSSCEQGRNCQSLNGSWHFESKIGNGSQGAFGETEFRECSRINDGWFGLGGLKSRAIEVSFSTFFWCRIAFWLSTVRGRTGWLGRSYIPRSFVLKFARQCRFVAIWWRAVVVFLFRHGFLGSV